MNLLNALKGNRTRIFGVAVIIASDVQLWTDVFSPKTIIVIGHVVGLGIIILREFTNTPPGQRQP